MEPRDDKYKVGRDRAARGGGTYIKHTEKLTSHPTEVTSDLCEVYITSVVRKFRPISASFLVTRSSLLTKGVFLAQSLSLVTSRLVDAHASHPLSFIAAT